MSKLSCLQVNTTQSPKLYPHHSLIQLSAFKPKVTLGKKTTPNLSMKCYPSHHFDQKQRFDKFSSPMRASSTDDFYSSQSASVAAVEFPAPRVFVGYSIYKGKAAFQVEPRAPEFAPLASGAFKLAKEGFVLLQFAPAVGVRQYDWSRKQVFSLSITEIGNLVSLGSRDACEFFHDPNKGKSDEGKVRKVLKVEPLPDGSGHFFNLSVQNRLINVDESIYIPVTRAEYAVLVSAFNYILPHLLGWHAFANSIRPNDNHNRLNDASPRYGRDYEWSR